jgi:hypothetical protein
MAKKVASEKGLTISDQESRILAAVAAAVTGLFGPKDEGRVARDAVRITREVIRLWKEDA